MKQPCLIVPCGMDQMFYTTQKQKNKLNCTEIEEVLTAAFPAEQTHTHTHDHTLHKHVHILSFKIQNTHRLVLSVTQPCPRHAWPTAELLT